MNKQFLRFIFFLLMCFTLPLTATAQVVDLPDPNLRDAIENALGKPVGASITVDEMAALTRLEAPNANISDLTGLEHATNLTGLWLGDKEVEGKGWINSNSIKDLSPLGKLTDLTWLNLSQNNISDISPLAELINLTWLDVGGNSLSNISPVAELANLTALRLWRNNISDISPVASLIYLTELNFHSNNISDISPIVANTGLGSGATVEVRGNPLSSVSISTHIPALQSRGVTIEFDNRTPATLLTISGVITELDNLLIVEVRDNNGLPFEGVPVMFTVTSGDGTLSVTSTTTDADGRAESQFTLDSGGGTNTVRASVEGISESVTFNDDAADIPDPNLRAAIENAFGKTPGTPIAPAEMAALTHLEARNANISDLTGLEFATNLKWLWLDGEEVRTGVWSNSNSVSNLSPLAGLIHLESLDLWKNSVSDLSALAGLTNLTHLGLVGNAISDVSALAGLTNLESLFLDSNPISDLSALAGLTNLTRLGLDNISISDISALTELTNLRWMRLAWNNISDLSPLVVNTGLGNGDEIYVQGNPLSYQSIYTYIPTLQSRGVTVEFDNRTPITLLNISGVITELDNLLIVEVRDSNGLAFEGVPVTFTVISGGGTLIVTSTMTDENGRAESQFTLDSVEVTNTVRASVEGLSESVTFTPSVRTNGMIRLVYFLPSDRRARPDRVAALRQLIKEAQQFYADEMHRHGFGQKTFTVETDEDGEPVVHHINGKFTEEHYHNSATDYEVWAEIQEHFGDLHHTYFVAIDLSYETLYKGKSCGIAAVSFRPNGGRPWLRNREETEGEQAIGGFAIIPASGDCFRLRTTAHELGHAFGLNHDFREGLHGDYVMAYGPQTRLSKCAAEWLSVSRFFNTKSVSLNAPGEIQLPSIRTYSREETSLRFEITDPDGLHHAQLVLPEGSLGPILFNCQRLNGEASTVEFVISTAELIHRITLKVIDAGRITLQIIDLGGDITWARFPIQLDDVLPTLEKISGDNQKGASFAPLSQPFVVEVQGANGSALAGVPVTFAIVAGDGTLINTSTTTDENGRAQTTLTLGPNLGTNTVSISATGIQDSVTFNATADYLPTEYLLSIPAGISLIHVPLKVTTVDGVPKTITSIADLYDALGGPDNVNLLITHDSTMQRWHSYLGDMNRGTVADPVLTDDKGIIAVMNSTVFLRLGGNALGTNGSSSITLHPGINLVGVPLRDSRIARVTDLFALEGIGRNVPFVIFPDNGALQTVGQSGAVIVLDNGAFQTVGQVGDASDITITGGQAFILTAKKAATVAISGTAWYNFSEMVTNVPPLITTGIEVEDTTPVLALGGSIIDQGTHVNKAGFSVTVKNLSTDKVTTTIIGDENHFSPDKWESKEVEYQLTIVDAETGQAAMIGDILEISVQAPESFIGAEPLQYTVTAEDVRQSRIHLPALVIYEILWETELLPNYPNPFTPETWIPYRLSEDAVVTLTIYDLSGHVVRTLEVGHRTAAVYESESKAIYWDGRNDVGEQVASGIYFYTLAAGAFSATRKMVMLK